MLTLWKNIDLSENTTKQPVWKSKSFRTGMISVTAAVSALCLTACINNSKSTGSKKQIDAMSGATGLGCTRLNVSKAEGRKLVYDFLKSSGPFILTTVDGNVPCARPLGIVMEHDGKIWFHVGKHKASYFQIKKNPNVEIVSVKPKGGWIRISGKAVFEDNPEVDAETFKQTPGLKKIYNEKSGHTLGHFYITGGVAEISTANKVEQILF